MQKKIWLPENEMPTHWYNVVADMPNAPAPPLGPDGQPVGPDALSAIFPQAIIEQEMSAERWIKIPDEVREKLLLWRPTPLVRATELEKALGTPCKIFFKNEAVSPAGSHKPNSAIPQAYYNKQEGVKRLITETGAGQWGSSLALAGNMFDLDVRICMVKVSYDQKPYRRLLMQTWGGNVFASPTDMTQVGRDVLTKDPDSQGSLGIAIAEAVEEAGGNPEANYALGSVLNHVLLHQTIIGQEAKKQLEMVGEYPDMVFAPSGGGSNLGGLAFPFFADKAAGKDVRLVGVEPTSCPSLTKGEYTYDYGDSSGLTPMMKMYTLGHDFMPPGIHAGGLRYHGQSALVSQLHHEGLLEAMAVGQTETFEAGVLFARTEGIVPAPESNHAIAAVIQEALRCKETGEAKTLLFNLSGHGHFDMSSYDRFFKGELEDYEYPEEAIKASLATLPKF
ncbi:TrpB-like pyridoxal phosphate-dependent enzyme [Oceanospirillum linum]|uniref:Tryptophan synthase beta chain n=1 Tax=Oceanospirillum linum TaxID=966 RepID=A0A1T1HB67_OCELI|nr:TrpB-like pyridoxal phosphate-dependent enzyme [Oceanospirillum linum]OOV87075.1 TrpB-like pyridoxal-phosphate dependent enzyme [Oceanospirillum linum]SEF73683.1 tryptophan synthase beta chain [Oleiphilus messinensis]SMP16456.1 tryptophan synthase beta chain/tryptophan synthase beta chain [Oceanospirillum linum]